MPRPTKQQIDAAAAVLARDWDADGSKAARVTPSYAEWGAGVADMIIHQPTSETLVEYLGVLEEQIGVVVSSREDRARWAAELEAAVSAAAV